MTSALGQLGAVGVSTMSVAGIGVLAYCLISIGILWAYARTRWYPLYLLKACWVGFTFVGFAWIISMSFADPGPKHGGVVQVEKTRHHPVVCAAVEKALKEQVEPLALDLSGDGKTLLDEVVLSIVNAIPQEGRMSLEAQPEGDKEGGEEREITDEQIDKLDERLR